MELSSLQNTTDFDYSYVPNPARVAIYDDLLSAPRVLEVSPAPTPEFMNALASETYNQAQALGGTIPYTAIKQVAENFIHANFREIVVSIMDGGNTIRFTDQGPGIKDKERALQPGFSSATAPMKQYIDGVGSGLPIVREYLDVKHGHLQIDDNLNGGSVVTLTVNSDGVVSTSAPLTTPVHEAAAIHEDFSHSGFSQSLITMISSRGRAILMLFQQENIWGVQDIAQNLGYPNSSTHAELKKLEEFGLIEKLGTKRIITDLGEQVANSL